MAEAERKLSNGRSRIDFRTDPSKYRHWKLGVDGEVATALGVDTALTQLAGTADEAAGAVIQLPGRLIEAAPGRSWDFQNFRAMPEVRHAEPA